MHHANDFGLDQTHGLHVYRAEDQYIQRILVVTIGLRNESIICRIVDGGKKYTVQFEHSAVFVEFVFGLAAFGDLDDGVDVFGTLIAVVNMVPGILSVLLNEMSGLVRIHNLIQ